MRKITSSPWGLVQSQDDLGEGISFVSTASHGGYYVPAEKVAEMPYELRYRPTFTGGSWYEEDNDWPIVMLSFPHLFTDGDIFFAIRSVHSSEQMYDNSFPKEKNHWRIVRQWLEGKAEHIQKRADKWKEENSENWIPGCCSSMSEKEMRNLLSRDTPEPVSDEDKLPKGCWCVFAHRVGDDAEKKFITKKYPDGVFSEFDDSLILKEI